MTQISNAEKQVRFRKKEYLKRCADKIFDQWVCSTQRFRYSRRPEKEVRRELDEAAKLPYDWKQEDYEFAKRKIEQYRIDLLASDDQVANDVDGDWTLRVAKSFTTPYPIIFHADNKAEIEKARALASHIISALNISDCNGAGQAAALMEALRFVGRNLVSNREIHCSQATAVCLSTVGPQYDRPKWFAEKLAEAIKQQIGEDLAHEVGQHLNKL